MESFDFKAFNKKEILDDIKGCSWNNINKEILTLDNHLLIYDEKFVKKVETKKDELRIIGTKIHNFKKFKHKLTASLKKIKKNMSLLENEIDEQKLEKKEDEKNRENIEMLNKLINVNNLEDVMLIEENKNKMKLIIQKKDFKLEKFLEKQKNNIILNKKIDIKIINDITIDYICANLIQKSKNDIFLKKNSNEKKELFTKLIYCLNRSSNFKSEYYIYLKNKKAENKILSLKTQKIILHDPLIFWIEEIIEKNYFDIFLFLKNNLPELEIVTNFSRNFKGFFSLKSKLLFKLQKIIHFCNSKKISFKEDKEFVNLLNQSKELFKIFNKKFDFDLFIKNQI